MGQIVGNLTEISGKSKRAVGLRLFLYFVKNVNIYNNFAHISEKLRTFALAFKNDGIPSREGRRLEAREKVAELVFISRAF